ncbi:hypothetical protein GOODEAATRI_030008, partial [Goodea atripinnis]
AEGIATDPAKVAVVQHRSAPVNVRELQSFLGLASYFHCLIGGFTTIAIPLHCSNHKNSTQLQQAFTKTQVLAYLILSCLSFGTQMQAILELVLLLRLMPIIPNGATSSFDIALCTGGGRLLDREEPSCSCLNLIHCGPGCLSLFMDPWEWETMEMPKPSINTKGSSTGLSECSHAPLQQYLVGARLGDILGPFPITQSSNWYILVAMDYFTKWPKACVVSDQSATLTAKKLKEEMLGYLLSSIVARDATLSLRSLGRCANDSRWTGQIAVPIFI